MLAEFALPGEADAGSATMAFPFSVPTGEDDRWLECATVSIHLDQEGAPYQLDVSLDPSFERLVEEEYPQDPFALREESISLLFSAVNHLRQLFHGHLAKPISLTCMGTELLITGTYDTVGDAILMNGEFDGD